MRLPMLLLTSWLVALAPSARAEPSPRDRFAGSYVYAGGDPQRAALESAIDKAVEPMFFAVRPIARGKLHDKTEIKSRIGFSFAGGNVTSTASDEAPATSREDGTSTSFKAGGEKLVLSQKLTPEGHLVQTFVAAEGTRINDYVLAADGKLLTVSVTLVSKKLEHPLRYVLTYRKS